VSILVSIGKKCVVDGHRCGIAVSVGRSLLFATFAPTTGPCRMHGNADPWLRHCTMLASATDEALLLQSTFTMHRTR
jgi:hypothetical protein